MEIRNWLIVKMKIMIYYQDNGDVQLQITALLMISIPVEQRTIHVFPLLLEIIFANISMKRVQYHGNSYRFTNNSFSRSILYSDLLLNVLYH